MTITAKEQKEIERLMQNEYDFCLTALNDNAYNRHQSALHAMMHVMTALGYDSIDDNGKMRLELIKREVEA